MHCLFEQMKSVEEKKQNNNDALDVVGLNRKRRWAMEFILIYDKGYWVHMHRSNKHYLSVLILNEVLN